MELNVWTCEIHHCMLQLTANLNSLAVDQCTPTNTSLVFYYVFILFKLVLSYVTQYFNQSNGLNMLRFTTQYPETHGYWNCCNALNKPQFVPHGDIFTIVFPQLHAGPQIEACRDYKPGQKECTCIRNTGSVKHP